jgi:hypothetical protein
MTHRLRIAWPDERLFEQRGGRPLRLLALSDEPDPTLDSPAVRASLEPIDLIIGCGDLRADYLTFVADAFHSVPLVYVRGNHDTGEAWAVGERTTLPEPIPDGKVRVEAGLPILGFSGSPVYNAPSRVQVSAPRMWLRAARGWLASLGRRPLLVISHTPPRGLNDAEDRTHRGFGAFRWLLDMLRPPLWLHGHTALVRRGLDSRSVRHDGTLLYNCTGSTLVELVPPSGNGANRGVGTRHGQVGIR